MNTPEDSIEINPLDICSKCGGEATGMIGGIGPICNECFEKWQKEHEWDLPTDLSGPFWKQ